MDALHWDTFELEHEPWDSDVSIRAQKLIQTCPCNPYQPRCLRCRFAQLLLPRTGQNLGDVPKSRKSPLELVCSPNRRASSHRMDMEAFLEQYFGDWEEYNEFEAEASASKELDAIAKALDNKLDNELDNELDTELGIRITDREFQMTAALSFHSPALQLLWAPRFTSRRERGLQRLGADRIVVGDTYGRGVGHALGVWANCEHPSIWILIWYWIRRQREKLVAYFSQGSPGNT